MRCALSRKDQALQFIPQRSPIEYQVIAWFKIVPFSLKGGGGGGFKSECQPETLVQKGKGNYVGLLGQSDEHPRKPVRRAAAQTWCNSKVVVELSKGCPELTGHLKLEAQPCREFACPVDGAGTKILRLDGGVKLFENPG